MATHFDCQSETIHMENGERVYPCRCGQTHRGPQAEYDYGHHNCLHTAPLIRLAGVSGKFDDGHLMCPQCGKDFWIESRRKPTLADEVRALPKRPWSPRRRWLDLRENP